MSGGYEPHFYFGVSETLKKESNKAKTILTKWNTSRPFVDLKAVE